MSRHLKPTRVLLLMPAMVATVLGTSMITNNAQAAWDTNGQWHHAVMVKSDDQRVRCIAMQYPGNGKNGGKVFTTKVTPGRWSSLGRSVFHFGSSEDGLSYSFSAFDNPSCAGSAIGPVLSAQEPNDSLANWWVQV